MPRFKIKQVTFVAKIVPISAKVEDCEKVVIVSMHFEQSNSQIKVHLFFNNSMLFVFYVNTNYRIIKNI